MAELQIQMEASRGNPETSSLWENLDKFKEK